MSKDSKPSKPKRERLDWRVVYNSPAGKRESARTKDGYRIQRITPNEGDRYYSHAATSETFKRLGDALKDARS